MKKLLLPFAAALLPAFAGAQDLLVRASRIAVTPETVLSPGQLLVRQGKVVYVGDDIPTETRNRAKLVDYGQATIVPGFVMVSTTLGQDRDLAEAAIAFTPDLRASEAFDPWEEDLLKLPHHGITAAALSPSPRNVAGGLQALVKPGREQGLLAASELQLVLSLGAAARNPEREPTSLMGQREMLRQAFQVARNGANAGPEAGILREVLQGTRRAFVHANSFAELSAALDLARDQGFAPVLVGCAEGHKLVTRLAQQQVSVVLPALQPESPRHLLQLPAQLAAAGVPFAFGGAATQLRMSAVLAVRNGLSRTVALQALTMVPARMLEQQAVAYDHQARIGSLRQDHAADFVVFDGDPLDLDAAHLATWVHGELVAGKPAPAPTNRTPSATAGER